VARLDFIRAICLAKSGGPKKQCISLQRGALSKLAAEGDQQADGLLSEV